MIRFVFKIFCLYKFRFIYVDNGARWRFVAADSINAVDLDFRQQR